MSSTILFSFTSGVGYASWRVVYDQPNDLAAKAEAVNWQSTIQVANDRVFDLKVEAGLVPPPQGPGKA